MFFLQIIGCESCTCHLDDVHSENSRETDEAHQNDVVAQHESRLSEERLQNRNAVLDYKFQMSRNLSQ